MAQDVISTLFNTTPRNAAWNQYMQDNMIDVNAAGRPYQDLGRANIERASAMMQNAGTGLGIGIGRLLGGMTPQMAQEQQVQGLLGGASFQDPDQLMMASERFAQAGDIPRAQALMGQAQTLRAARIKEQEARDAKAAADAKAQAAQTAYQNRLKALQSRFPNMPEVEAQALAADEAAWRKLFEEQQAKVSAFGQQLIDAGFKPGTPEYQAKMNQFIKNELTPKKSIGEQIAAGLNPLVSTIATNQAQKAGAAAGQEVGKATATIRTGEKSLEALQNAKDILDKGIFAGGYGPLGEKAAKYTGGVLGSRDRVVNTEEFRSYIGQTVMPMMAQLGGSDSNEELKKMEAIMAANTTLEPEAMKNIINSAIKAVERDIKKIQDQQKAIETGQPLPTSSAGRTATKRWNPKTQQLETIKR